MSTSDEIRELARKGVAVAEIALRLGIRYQHAYKVCRDANLVERSRRAAALPITASRPILTVSHILQAGFKHAGCWVANGGVLSCSGTLPKSSGVYAFAVDGRALYVGLASRSLSHRLYFYGRPGSSQRTNIRLNDRIKRELTAGKQVEVYVAIPPSFEWNGLTISGPEGLEAGIIRDFDLPWNMRGT